MTGRKLDKAGGLVLHLLNRSAKRTCLFETPSDYRAFEDLLGEATTRAKTRLLAYCIMPNHWHLVVWPVDGEIPSFMQWLTMTHAKRWHAAHDSVGTGHLYQGRYRAIPVQTNTHLTTLLRYVERNPLRAGLVPYAQNWRWSSLWRRCNSCDDRLLSGWPIPQPHNWLELVNEPQTVAELEEVRRALILERPYGDPAWTATSAGQIGRSLQGRGRPRRRTSHSCK